MNKYAKLKLNRLYEAFFTSAIDILAPQAQEPQEKAFEMEGLLAGARATKDGQQSGLAYKDVDQLTAKIKQQTEELRYYKELFAYMTQRNSQLEQQLERVQAAEPGARDADFELQNANIQLMQALEDNKTLQEEVRQLKEQEANQRQRMGYLQQENYNMSIALQNSSTALPADVQQRLDVLKQCEKMLQAEDEGEQDAAEQVRKFVESQLYLREAGIFITFNDYDKLNQVSDYYEALQAQLNLSGQTASPQKNRLPDAQQQNFFYQLTTENAQLNDKLQQLENENLALKTRVSEVYEINSRYEQQLSKKGVFRKENTRQIELETRLKQQQLLIYQLQDKMRTERNSRVSQFRESQIEQSAGIQSSDALDDQALRSEIDGAKRAQRKAEDELLYCYEKLKLAVRKNDAFSGQIEAMLAELAEVRRLQGDTAETLRLKLEELGYEREERLTEVLAEKQAYDYRILTLYRELAAKDEASEAALAELRTLKREEAEKTGNELVYMRGEIERLCSERDELQAQVYLNASGKQASAATPARNDAQQEIMTLKYQIDALHAELQEREQQSVQLVPESYVLLLRYTNGQLQDEIYGLRKDIKKLREKAQRLHAAEAASQEAAARCEALNSALEQQRQATSQLYQYLSEQAECLKACREAKEALDAYVGYQRAEYNLAQQKDNRSTDYQFYNAYQHRIEELEQLLQERSYELARLQQSSAKKEKELVALHESALKKLNGQLFEVQNRLGAQTVEHRLQLSQLYEPRLQASQATSESLRTERFLANSFEEVGRWNQELLQIKAGLRMTKMLQYQVSHAATETLSAAAAAVRMLLAKTFAANTLSETRSQQIVIKQLYSDLYDYRLENQLLSLQLQSEEGAIYKSRIGQLEQLCQRQSKRILAFQKQMLRCRRAEDALQRCSGEMRTLKVELSKTRAQAAKIGACLALEPIEVACALVRPRTVGNSSVYAVVCANCDDSSTQTDNSAFYPLRDQITELQAAIRHVRQQIAGLSWEKSAACVQIVLTSCDRLTLRFYEQQLDAEEAGRLRQRCLNAEQANVQLEKSLVQAKISRNNWLFRLSKCRDQLLRQSEQQEAGIYGLEARLSALAAQWQAESVAVRARDERSASLVKAFSGLKYQLSAIQDIKTVISNTKLMVSRSMRLEVTHAFRTLRNAACGRQADAQQLDQLGKELEAKAHKIQELSAKVLDQNYRYNTLKEVYDATKAQLLLAERRTDEAMKQGKRSRKLQEELELYVSDLVESNQELYNSAVLLETRLRAQEGQTRLQKLRKQENQLVASLNASQTRRYPQLAYKLDAAAIVGMAWTTDTVLIAMRALFGKHFSKQLIYLQRRKASQELVRQLTLAYKKIQLSCEAQLSAELRSQAFADVCDFVGKLVEEKGGLGV